MSAPAAAPTVGPAIARRRGAAAHAGRLMRALAIGAWLVLIVWAAWAGVAVRDWAWRTTASIRFHGDIENAVRIGDNLNRDAMTREGVDAGRPQAAPSWGTLATAYLRRYDRAYAEAARTQRPPAAAPGRPVLAIARRDAPPAVDPPDARFDLDYPPGRLALVTAWVRTVRTAPASQPATSPTTAPASLGAIGRNAASILGAFGAPRPAKAVRGAVAYDDAIAAPMLGVNLAHEAAAALGAFALCLRVLRDAGRPRGRAVALATLAALLVWLNPAVILDAHGWPQWDAWVLPYAIWATWCAASDRWMGAGALLVVGAMFKGQSMMLAPLLALWPIARADLDALARLVAGAALAAAACASPWLLATPEARWWIGGVAVAWMASGVLSRRRRPHATAQAGPCRAGFLRDLARLRLPRLRSQQGFGEGASVDPVDTTLDRPREPLSPPLPQGEERQESPYACAAPESAHDRLRAQRRWVTRLPLVRLCRFGTARSVATRAGVGDVGRRLVNWRTLRLASIALLVLLALAWIVGPFCVAGTGNGNGDLRPVAVLVAAIAVLLPGAWRGRTFAAGALALGVGAMVAGARFNGSFAWLHVGFQTDHYPTMRMGNVANLPAVLAATWRWDVGSPVSVFGARPLELRTLLRICATLLLAILAFASARASRRGDANLLVVLPAAWLAIYATLPQMHERYLLWAAATSALLAARGLGGLLAHLGLTAASLAMVLVSMIESARQPRDPSWEWWHRTLAGLQPGLGYGVATLAVVLVVWACTRERGPTPRRVVPAT